MVILNKISGLSDGVGSFKISHDDDLTGSSELISLGSVKMAEGTWLGRENENVNSCIQNCNHQHISCEDFPFMLLIISNNLSDSK